MPNLIASAVSSRGSVDNVNAIISGLRNSGFAQSDVAYWAYTGTGTMEGKAPAKDLRTIAALFQEHIHLIALKDSKINSVKDLKGKRVSLDEPGSTPTMIPIDAAAAPTARVFFAPTERH